MVFDPVGYTYVRYGKEHEINGAWAILADKEGYSGDCFLQLDDENAVKKYTKGDEYLFMGVTAIFDREYIFYKKYFLFIFLSIKKHYL